jgi:hypothetical protein
MSLDTDKRTEALKAATLDCGRDVTRWMHAIIALKPGNGRELALLELLFNGSKAREYYTTSLMLGLVSALPTAVLQSVMPPDDPPPPSAPALANAAAA